MDDLEQGVSGLPELTLPRQARVVLIAGVMASGKSSVAQALAERFPRGVHLRGDAFRRMIVRGRAEMGAELPPEGARQLELRYRIAADAARRYVGAGFHVAYQDVIVGEALGMVQSFLDGLPVTTVVLCPSPETVWEREQARGKRGYANFAEVLAFDRLLRERTPRLGLWLDSSDQRLEDTVDAILEHVTRSG